MKKIFDYIEDIPRFTKKHSREYLVQFLQFLGNPEKGKKVIHVAGTNGKGTVCSYIKAMLLASGKDVGCFTSPHLMRLNERMNMNGKDISDAEFTECFQIVKGVVDKMDKEGLSHPSYFEFLFGMALVAFHKNKLTYLILETGIGGRLDATNIIESPLLTLITSIGLDHQEILGETLEEIAGEKAGIIKKGTPLIYDAQDPIVTKVISKIAMNKQCDCYQIVSQTYKVSKVTEKGIAFWMRDSYYEKTIWNTKGQGIWQVKNAALALEAMRLLEAQGEVNKDLHAWKEAMQTSLWQGRMQQIEAGIILDGAHNLSAMQQFVKSVTLQEKQEIVILFAVMRDKPYQDMIRCLCESLHVKEMIITTLQDTRSVEVKELHKEFARYAGVSICETHNTQEAWQKVREIDKTNKTVYCLGSLYLIGEILGLWKEA